VYPASLGLSLAWEWTLRGCLVTNIGHLPAASCLPAGGLGVDEFVRSISWQSSVVPQWLTVTALGWLAVQLMYGTPYLTFHHSTTHYSSF